MAGSIHQFRSLLIVVLSLSVLGVVQFLICTGIAMSCFPDGYTFADHFLSDLGRSTVEQHGLYNGSLIVLGVSLIPLFGMVWVTDPRGSFTAKATAVFGILSCLGIIGLGMTPIDRYFFAHYAAIAIWLFPMLYMVVAFFYVASRSPYVGIGFLSASLLMVVGMIGYLLSVELTTYELLQKAVVACGLIWLFYVIAFISQSGIMMLNQWDDGYDDREDKEAEYFSTLQTGRGRK